MVLHDLTIVLKLQKEVWLYDLLFLIMKMSEKHANDQYAASCKMINTSV